MKKIEFLETLEFILIFLVIFLPVRLFVFEPFVVIGESMEPNFHSADYLIICKICTKLEGLKRGDVIIFRPPVDESKYYIKRIIGLPNEKVVIKGNEIYIFNKQFPNGFKLEETYLTNKNFYMEDYEIQLKNNEYFVLGDNREESYDSRKWGPLSENRIVGKVFLRINLLGRLIKIINFNNIL